jgi:hypothetical protein
MSSVDAVNPSDPVTLSFSAYMEQAAASARAAADTTDAAAATVTWRPYVNRIRIGLAPNLPVDFRLTAATMVCSQSRIKCYCLSDLHADADKNLEWVQTRCVRTADDAGCFTILILPGDIGSSIDRLDQVFRTLVTQFDAVIYVPGNHEAWRRMGKGGPGEKMAVDSVSKMLAVLECARAAGVYVGPLRVTTQAAPPATVALFPLHAWYHSSWDTEPNLTHDLTAAAEMEIPFVDKWADFSMCTWPASVVSHADFASITSDSTALAEAFAGLNEPFLHPPDDDDTFQVGSPLIEPNDTVISFSHFVPRQELCIEKRFLIESQLSKVIGSDALEAQVRRLSPHLHVFGHTHLPIDLELDGIRYLQWPLGYAHEATAQCSRVHSAGPLLVYDSALGTGADAIPYGASVEAKWSAYYRSTPRNSSDTINLAPWVVTRLRSVLDMMGCKQSTARRSAAARDHDRTSRLSNSPQASEVLSDVTP